MSPAKLAIVLVHGAWLTPDTWKPIIAPLESFGYQVYCPKLPSTGGDPAVPDMSQDITTIRNTVLGLLEKDMNVLVVLHSYAGLPGGNALEGLDVASRRKAGKESHVVRLVYISGYLVVEGTQLNPKGTRANMVPAMVTDFEVRL